MDMSTMRQWVAYFSSDSNSISLLLVQIFMNAGCRLLFMAGEHAQVMGVTVLKNSVFSVSVFCAFCRC